MATPLVQENIILAANYVIAKIIGASKPTTDAIASFLSYAVEGSEFSPMFATGNWDGRSSFYSRRDNTFPAGFIHLVHGELKRLGHKVVINVKATPEPLGPEHPVVDSFPEDPRYDFQMQALRAVESHKRGVIQVATGGGKSKIAKLIAARFRRMTMFLTTRGILMYQMAEGFKEAGFNAGIIGDSEFRPVKGINCGMVQTFVAKLKAPDLTAETMALIASNAKLAPIERLDDEGIAAEAEKRFFAKERERARYIKLLEMVEVVIGEEAHEAGGNSYYEILRHCRNAGIRVALTATPFMRSDSEDNMRLMAAFGPILIKVSEKLLIARGILAKPYFKFKTLPRPKGLYRTTPWQRAYKIGYIENEAMHAEIVADARQAANVGLATMTLVQRTGHGKTLEKLMKAAGLRVAFIRGENDQAERKKQLGRLKKGEIDVLIGTTILDVGVDVPAVGFVQLAGGGKAEIALRQRIGRGLRAKKGMANIAFVTDYSVELNSTLMEHTAQRRSIIEATDGFVQGILSKEKDHDWALFTNKNAL